MNNDINSELESFRQQWREEVRARNQGREQDPSSSAASTAATTSHARATGPPAQTSSAKKPSKGDEEYQARALEESEASQINTEHRVKRVLVTALDHYEEAVETEGQGNLGEALRLYKKAFRVSILGLSDFERFSWVYRYF